MGKKFNEIWKKQQLEFTRCGICPKGAGRVIEGYQTLPCKRKTSWPIGVAGGGAMSARCINAAGCVKTIGHSGVCGVFAARLKGEYVQHLPVWAEKGNSLVNGGVGVGGGVGGGGGEEGVEVRMEVEVEVEEGV